MELVHTHYKFANALFTLSLQIQSFETETVRDTSPPRREWGPWYPPVSGQDRSLPGRRGPVSLIKSLPVNCVRSSCYKLNPQNYRVPSISRSMINRTQYTSQDLVSDISFFPLPYNKQLTGPGPVHESRLG